MDEKEDENSEKVTYYYKVCYETEMQHFRANYIATNVPEYQYTN